MATHRKGAVRQSGPAVGDHGRYGTRDRRRHTGGRSGQAAGGEARTGPPWTGVRRALPPAGRADRPVHLRARHQPHVDAAGAGDRRAGGRRRGDRVLVRDGGRVRGAAVAGEGRRHRRAAGRLLPDDTGAPRAARIVRGPCADGPHGRGRSARRARRRRPRLAGDPVQPGPGRLRHRADRRGRARHAAPWSRSTTPSPPRSGSGPWTSAPTSRWPATPRPSPGTAT